GEREWGAGTTDQVADCARSESGANTAESQARICQRKQPGTGGARAGGAAHEGKIRRGDQDHHRLQKELSCRSAMSGFNLQELMSQAKKQYETLQKKMQETIVEGSAGGGTVTVKMDGRKQVLSVKIDPEVVKSGDVEMLQDLVAAAINGAGKKVDESMQSAMGGMLGGMGIPGIG